MYRFHGIRLVAILVCLATPVLAQMSPEEALELMNKKDAPSSAGPQIQTERVDTSKMTLSQLRALVAELYDQIDALNAELAGVTEGADSADMELTVEDVPPSDTDQGKSVHYVKIVANDPANLSDLNQKLRDAKSILHARQQHVRDAKSRLVNMQGSYLPSADTNDQKRKRYTPEELREQKVEVKKCEREETLALREVKQIERDITDASVQRTIVGSLQNGTPVTIVARGPYLTVGTRMQVNRIYAVKGPDRMTGSMLRIFLRSAEESAFPVAAQIVYAADPVSLDDANADGVVAFFTGLPHELRPRVNENWQPLQQQLMQKWFDENRVGTYFFGTVKFESASLQGNTIFTRCKIESVTIDGITYRDVQIAASFPHEKGMELARLSLGQSVKIAGKVTQVHASGRPATAGKLPELDVVLTLIDCDLP